jgi:hypothetical protein
MDRHARNERNLVVREHEPTGTFVPSDGSETQVHEHRIDGGLWLLGSSVIFLVFGFVLFASNLGWA